MTTFIPLHRTFEYKTSNFPHELYKLEKHDHLTKLLRVLLEDAGVGQLHKIQTVARLSESLRMAQFGELDYFFGTFLRMARLPQEMYEADPFSDQLSASDWRLIERMDASYRERLRQFLTAILHGGTANGLTMAAQAASGVPCQILEAWRYLDNLGLDAQPGRVGSAPREFVIVPMLGSYSEVQTISVTGATAGTFTLTWSGKTTTPIAYNATSGQVRDALADLSNIGDFRVAGGPGPSNAWVVLFDVPHMTMTANSASLTGATATVEGSLSYSRRRAIYQAVNRLKPANTICTVDERGMAVRKVVVVRHAASPSEYFEIRKYVTAVDPPKAPPSERYFWVKDGVEMEAPTFAHLSSMESQWSLNDSVTNVDAFEIGQDGIEKRLPSAMNNPDQVWGPWREVGLADSPDNYPNGKFSADASRYDKDGQYVFSWSNQQEYVEWLQGSIEILGGDWAGNRYRLPSSSETNPGASSSPMDALAAPDIQVQSMYYAR